MYIGALSNAVYLLKKIKLIVSCYVSTEALLYHAPTPGFMEYIDIKRRGYMLVYCSVQIFIVLYLSVVGVWGRRGEGRMFCVCSGMTTDVGSYKM